GIKADMYGAGTITVTNYGDIAGIYGEGLYGEDNAWGIHARSTAGDIVITNAASGFIDVYADEEDGTGIQANAGTGDIAIANNGIIDVYGNWYAYGIVANAGNGTIDVTNAGSIDVYASNDYAYGVKAVGYGDITVGNTGVIDVYADNDGAVGVYASAGGYGDVAVTNTGSFDSYGNFTGGVILVDSYGWNAGIEAHTTGSGDVTLTNSGLIDVVSWSDSSNGIWTTTTTGDLTVTNTATGVILADSNGAGNYGYAWGIDARSFQGGAVGVYNNGGVIAAEGVYAYGINALAYNGGDVTVGNSGGVFATGSDDAYAINARNYGAGNVSVTNSGYVVAEAAVDYASGIYASTSGGTGDIAITNTGNGLVDVSSAFGSATGIDAFVDMGLSLNDGGDISITNAGDVLVQGYGTAIGVAVQVNEGSNYYPQQGYYCSYIGGCTGVNGYVPYNGYVITQYSYSVSGEGGMPVLVNNSGLIDVASGYSNAEGISIDMGNGSYGELASVTNSGGIDVSTDYGFLAWGIHVDNNYGDISVVNTASGTIETYNGSAPFYLGGGGYSVGVRTFSSFGDTVITNAGDIIVGDSPWRSNGVRADNKYGDVTVNNLVGGSITVSTGGFDAYGVEVDNRYGDVIVNNYGSIAVGGGAWNSKGIEVQNGSGGTAINTFAGSAITVTGEGSRATGGILAMSSTGDIAVTSAGAVTVTASGDYGDAFGIFSRSFGGSISIGNAGNIVVAASGDYGDAFGIYSESFGDDTLIGNSGNVRATSVGGEAWAVYHRGGDVAITNTASGNIFGVIQTDDGDDSFTNSGDWYATEGDNKYSDFAGGDDSVVNNTGARIFMEDSWVDMGSASAYGSNSFMNNGKIFVDGKYNVIDMGTPTSVFTNNGASLHFEDGAADDQLRIFGDFAGTGHIVVDADGTSMLADRLYIDGDVLTNTANVIDVFMNEYPSLQAMIDGEQIDVVHVTGTSLAANFNLGDVTVAEDSLFSVDVSLIKDINYSGSNDLFSLGFEISGLTPTGVAASSIAPAVQSLWHLGVGTVFQRQGSSRDGKQAAGGNGMMSSFKDFSNNAMQVADYQGASGVWLRAFTEDGNVSPDASRNFGMGGAQGFDLKNTGIEFGAGYAFNEQWTAGLLGGTSESTLRPDIGGRAKVSADTFGGYVTYTPGNGFYADFSYRNMDFDGNGNAGGDDFRFKGDADGYSLELGYGFKTASGLIVEPQFQYSKMDISLDTLDYAQGDFELTDGDSSQLRAGVALLKTFQAGSGEWTPYASLSFINETDASNNYIIGGILTGNVDTSGNSTLVEAGATAHYGNMVFSGGVNWKDGGAYDSL
ncbi:MAG: autotransporter outer membrane beta-barrel domain-containing protein, partial [Arenimonas sp.]